jgi:hypothetical protein
MKQKVFMKRNLENKDNMIEEFKKSKVARGVYKRLFRCQIGRFKE